MAHRILVATSNAGKLRDFAGAAAACGITIASIPHFSSLPEVIIPILEGTNDVRIRFRRTTDRTIGDAISGVSLMLLAAAWIKTRPKRAGRAAA